MSDQGRTELHHMPPDLIVTVLKYIQKVCGFSGLGSCRLVSKTWLAAVQQYSGKAGCTANAENLGALCQILPNMASVAVTSDLDSAIFNLRPLQSCPQLTSIELSTTATPEQGFKYYLILDLPNTVREVKVRNTDVDYDSLAYGASCLTRLQYQLDKHMFVATSQPGTFPSTISLDSVWHWVEKWQYLEELELVGTHSKWQPFGSYLGKVIASLPRLRRLILENPYFAETVMDLIEPPLTLSNVRDLSLSSTTLPQEWFDLAFKFLPNLTALRFHSSEYPGAETYMKAETRVFDLKSLKLWRSGPSFLDLVSTGLESLQLNLKKKELPNVQYIIHKAGNLKCLTRLELHHLQCNGANTRPLQGLPLRELALHYCQGLELELFVPGALLSLTSLHIKEPQIRLLQVEGQKQEIQELADCGQIILGLPHLKELSGLSALFSFGIAEELQAWKVSSYHNDGVGKSDQHEYPERFQLKVWRKP